MNKLLFIVFVALLPFLSCIGMAGMKVNLKKFEEKEAEVINLPGDVSLLGNSTDLTKHCKGREVLRAQFLGESVVRVWCAR